MICLKILQPEWQSFRSVDLVRYYTSRIPCKNRKFTTGCACLMIVHHTLNHIPIMKVSILWFIHLCPSLTSQALSNTRSTTIVHNYLHSLDVYVNESFSTWFIKKSKYWIDFFSIWWTVYKIWLYHYYTIIINLHKMTFIVRVK